MRADNSSRPVSLSSALAAVLVLPVCMADGQDLLDQVRSGNKSAIESIHSISCRVTKSTPIGLHGPLPPVAAEYWWSMGSSRVRSSIAGQFSDSVIHNDVGRSVAKSRLPNGRENLHFYINRAARGEPHGPLDPWAVGLLKLCGPKAWPLTLDELLNARHTLRHVRSETIAGRELIVVALSLELDSGQSGEFEIWFDPRANYLACKLIGTFSGDGSKAEEKRKESQVLRFKEVSPTVYFPEQSETRFFKNGQLILHEVVRLSDIRINQPLPVNAFELAIPPGAKVVDTIQDKEYVVGTDGKAAGTSRPLQKFPPMAPGERPLAETSEESRPLTRWIVPASLIVVGIAGGLWLVGRWRLREEVT